MQSKDEIPGWQRGDTLSHNDALRVVMNAAGIPKFDTATGEGRLNLMVQYGFLTRSISGNDITYTRASTDPDMTPKPKAPLVEQWIPEHFGKRTITVADIHGVHHTIEVPVLHEENTSVRTTAVVQTAK